MTGAGRPLARAPHQPAHKIYLKAMVPIRRLQANPEPSTFRIHAALAKLGIDLSPRTSSADGHVIARP